MKKLDKFLLGHLLIPFIVISIFVWVFSKPLSVMALHLILITSIYTTAFFICRFWKSRFKNFSILLFSLISTMLLLVYIANFLSNSYWNNNVSFNFILTYLSDLNTVLEEVPFATASLFIALSGITSIIYWIYLKHITYLHSYDHKLTFTGSRVYIFITLFTTIYTSLSFAQTEPGLWDGEPLSNLALKTSIQSYLLKSTEEITFTDDKKKNSTHELQNIILIHADALRADHMSSYGYKRDTTPYISSLVNQGATQIDTGLSICSESICGMLAALGSQHADSIQKNTPLIHTYLKQAGYRTVFSGSGNFSWERLDSILSHDIDHFDRADLDEQFSIHDDSIILSTLSKMPDYTGIPTFFFLRYLSSHPIGRHFSQYRQYTPAEKNLLGYLFPITNDAQTLINAYDNYIIQLDDMVRQSVELLAQKGYIDNSMIIIYGDHGDALNEHGYYGHYNNLYQEEIRVPIIFKSSRPLKLQQTNFATLNDILPTILDSIDQPVPKDIDGISLLNPQKKRTTYHDSRTGIYAIVEKTPKQIYKLIYHSKTSQKFLFNLVTDPQEKHNLFTEPDILSTRLFAKLEKYINKKN